MKNIFLLFVGLSFVIRVNGQSIGIGTETPSPSALLEVSSTTQGFLPPRMTKEALMAIASPEMGLIVYCTDCGGGELVIYSGVYWKNINGGPISSPLVIGGSYDGGKVAYIYQPGDPGYITGEVHGMIAAPNDQGLTIWGCIGTNIQGAEGIVLGTGKQNTLDIVAGCSTSGIAARVCDDLVLGGYSDWRLPSKDELNKLFLNRAAIGGFINTFYWSSSEIDLNNAWGQDFFGPGVDQYSLSKNSNSNVRAVRFF